MSSTTPLLPKVRKDDYPIFLRVCHSPWASLDQSSLVLARGIFAAHTLVSFIIIMYWKLRHPKHEEHVSHHHREETAFELSTISYFVQTLYHLMAFSWTYMHLYRPHHAHDEDIHKSRVESFLSPPKQNPTTKNRFFFSLFYTAANTYPHVVTMVFWLIIVPHRRYPSWSHELFGDSKLKSFVIVNLHGVNSFIALFETFFLSSIRRQTPIWAHNVGLTSISAVYIFWAYICKWITGRYIYFFLNPKHIGTQNVLAGLVSFCALANIFFVVNYGITGFREALTKKGEPKSSTYQSLPH